MISLLVSFEEVSHASVELRIVKHLLLGRTAWLRNEVVLLVPLTIFLDFIDHLLELIIIILILSQVLERNTTTHLSLHVLGLMEILNLFGGSGIFSCILDFDFRNDFEKGSLGLD